MEMNKFTEVIKNMNDEEFDDLSSIFYDERYQRNIQHQEQIKKRQKEYIGKCYKVEINNEINYCMIIDIPTYHIDGSFLCFSFTKPTIFNSNDYDNIDVSNFYMADNVTEKEIVLQPKYVEIDKSEFFVAFDENIINLKQRLMRLGDLN